MLKQRFVRDPVLWAAVYVLTFVTAKETRVVVLEMVQSVINHQIKIIESTLHISCKRIIIVIEN